MSEGKIMNEKILSIKEVDGFKLNPNIKHASTYDGYIIKTDLQDVLIGINNSQSCCEQWGNIASEEDFESFIGAELIDIKLTDSALNTRMTNKVKGLHSDESCLMFVDLITNRGNLQFVCYNTHNGYYSHDAVVKSTQLNHETSL